MKRKEANQKRKKDLYSKELFLKMAISLEY